MKNNLLVPASMLEIFLLLMLLMPAASGQVRFCWMGEAHQQGLTLKAGIDGSPERVILLVSRHEDFTDALPVEGLRARDIHTFRVDGLEPDTRYYYVIETDGVRAMDKKGHFRTFPRGPADFSLAFGSCAKGEGQNHPVFETIRRWQPLFFLHMGDMHYRDIDKNQPELFRAAYESVLSAPRQAKLYRETPLVYMWDDHDFGPNNSDTLAPGKEAAAMVYREYAPHYRLPHPQAVYHAFTVGRVRFIVTDVRSQRTPYRQQDKGHKTMLGREQKEWFKQELKAAGNKHPLIVWVNPIPWIGDSPDGWSWFARERIELANFIKENNIRGLCMLSGDAHMLAIDDGSHSDYALGGGASFPVMHASSMGGGVSEKGGPYSEGAFPGSGQYGFMEVRDQGADGIEVRWRGFDQNNKLLLSYTFRVEDH